MSIAVTKAVWEGPSTITGSHLNVLLALAEWADDNGLSWYPVSAIAERVRLKERATQYILKQLATLGYIRIEEGRGRYNTSRYWVQVDVLRRVAEQEKVQWAAQSEGDKVQPLAPLEERKGAKSQQEKVQSHAEKVQSGDRKGAIAIAPEPLRTTNEPPEEPSGRGRASPLRNVPKPKSDETTIPQPFPLTTEMWQWAKEEGITDRINLKWHHDNFYEYWTELKGKGQKKKNWLLTWKKWMRSEADKAPFRGNSAGGKPATNQRQYVEPKRLRVVVDTDTGDMHQVRGTTA